MKLFISKLYLLYKRNGEPNPEFKLTIYLSMILWLLTWCIFLPSFTVIDLCFFEKKAKLNPLVIAVVSLLIAWMYHRVIFKSLFKQQRLKHWEKKYATWHIPSPLLYLVLILLPLLLLFLGPVLATWLTGGEILGNKIKGLIEKH